jgi:hypothetical protein
MVERQDRTGKSHQIFSCISSVCRFHPLSPTVSLFKK